MHLRELQVWPPPSPPKALVTDGVQLEDSLEASTRTVPAQRERTDSVEVVPYFEP